jgi:hypothetical protein
VGLVVFGKVALLHFYGKTPPLVGNVATLAVCGNFRLTENVLSETAKSALLLLQQMLVLEQLNCV